MDVSDAQLANKDQLYQSANRRCCSIQTWRSSGVTTKVNLVKTAACCNKDLFEEE
jgi:hypothetical protein